MAAPDLTERTISSTYKDLLQVSNSNAGVDGTLRDVSDGEGTASKLQISDAGVASTGTFDVSGDTTLAGLSIGGVTLTVTGTELNVLDGIAALDTDISSVSSSDDTLASAKAIKTYVDAEIGTHDADDLEGTTLASNVVSSSLTSIGTLIDALEVSNASGDATVTIRSGVSGDKDSILKLVQSGDIGMHIAYDGGVDDLHIMHDNGTTKFVTIQRDDGFVGIGTSAPDYLCHISGASSPDLMVEATDTSAANFRIKNTEGEFGLYTDGDELIIRDYGRSLNRMIFDEAGSVDLTASKLTIGGIEGGAGAVVTADGSGGISWAAASGGGGGGVTDLSFTATGGSLTVESSTGDDVSLPLANTTNWGVMSDEMFDKLDGDKLCCPIIVHDM